jgi:hypothetical protein
MTDRFSDKKQGSAPDDADRREEAVNEAMRCLLEDLSELSSAVEQLEKSTRSLPEQVDFTHEMPLRK